MDTSFYICCRQLPGCLSPAVNATQSKQRAAVDLDKLSAARGKIQHGGRDFLRLGER
jgi:hypothetical protein